MGTTAALLRSRMCASPTDPPPRPAAGTLARRARVLVVDDEPLVAESLRLLLSDEFSVTALTQPDRALAGIVGGETFDVILCDVMMDGMNGVELRNRIESVEP